MASISAALERLGLQFSIKLCQLSTDGTLCASSLEYMKTDHTAKKPLPPISHKQTLGTRGQNTPGLFHHRIVPNTANPLSTRRLVYPRSRHFRYDFKTGFALFNTALPSTLIPTMN